ncbi:DNA methyltransferase [Foetidibacter luteolus]|uniref:DNA methyltransferase n=1 Tax=Foetidibacter luteolus TaxID=2608880 RepID=UPI001A99C863|nr:DNA methyltransferase [Foetidibacter luteolus]
MQNPISQIRKRFENVPVNSDWCFKNVRSTEQWTHGYHRYPAKFLPNLVKKLIEEYTHPDETIADLFAGCGTTLVEAKVHGRVSVGVDINPVAELITKAKTKPIEPILLANKFKDLESRLLSFNPAKSKKLSLHERIDYWFFPEHKYKIAFLYERILRLHNEDLRTFFLVALSNVLKNCSKWLQSSTKPQIDPRKKPIDPFIAFRRQAKQMIKKNREFYEALQKENFIDTSCEIRLEDARNTTIESDSIGSIITSPPYVTSYEYADIHQLTGFWFEYIADLVGFRKNFIGTFYSLKQETDSVSFIGQEIINQLLVKDKRTAKEVANYFNDMHAVTQEMHRILKPGGHTCLVIGNTTFLEVKIKSAEVFSELLELSGFTLVEIIKRSIPHKLIPTIRDRITGKFAKLENKQSQLVYPEEYIIVAKKK